MARKIIWITASYFLDVDIPIVPKLCNNFLIEWYIMGDCKDLSKIEFNSNLTITNYQFKNSWYSPLMILEYSNFFKSITYVDDDIIYINIMGMPYLYPVLYYLIKHENIVIAAHNLKTPKGARYEFLNALYMKFLIKRFYNIHVFSKNQFDYLMSKSLGKNILFAPLALKDYGENLNHLKYKRNSKVFLSFGHIRRYKRIDFLIHAAQLAYEETHINFKVIIAGSCNDWSQYQPLIKYDFLFDIYIGFIDNCDVASYFRSSDYLVLPYQDIAQSGALSVAFNYNIPIIASDILGFKEFITDSFNGFLFESENIDSLKSLLIYCLNLNCDDYDIICNNVMKYSIENFGIDSICNKYLLYFNKI